MNSPERVSIFILVLSSVLLGLATSIEDMRSGKVRNRWLLVGLAAGIVGHSVNMIPLGVLSVSAALSYLRDVLLNTCLALVAGFALWRFFVWSAGDAKLFSTLTFLLPMQLYAKGYSAYFPAAVFLLNVFLFAFVLLLARASWSLGGLARQGRLARGPIRIDIRKIVAASVSFAKQFLMLTSLFSVARVGLNELPLQQVPGVVSLFCVLLALRYLLNRLPAGFKKRWLLPSALALLVFLAVTDRLRGEEASRSAGLCLAFMVVFAAIRYLIDVFVAKCETREVAVTYLDTRSVLSQAAVERVDSLGVKVSLLQGLTSEQIEVVRSRLPEGEKLAVYRTMPFSPLVFLGFLSTLLTGQSILHLVLKL